MISIWENWKQNIRPSSTENESETSTAENEIERLQCRYQRLNNEFKASQNYSRKQEKVINQLEMKLQNDTEQLKNEKLKNEKLEQENIKITFIKNKMGSMNCKFKFVTTILITLIAIMIGIIIWQVYENHKYKNDFEAKQKEPPVFDDQLGKLEIDNHRLETEKQNCDKDLKNIQTELQSRDRENQNYKTDLLEKQKELQASEERSNKLQTEKQRLEDENQKYKNDLQEKQKELQASEKQCCTFIDCE